MNLRFSWQQVAVMAIVAAVVVPLVLTHNMTALGGVLAAIAAAAGVVAKSPFPTAPPDEQPTKPVLPKDPPSLPVILIFVGCSFLGTRAVIGCAAAAETSYTAQQLQCVDRATTLAESKACRAEVDRAWHVVDGGVQ